jgi:PTS system nitrogen regulatory IIA component
MDLSDLITPEGIIPSLRAKAKKQVLSELAERASQLTGIEHRVIFETLWQRERLGSTGVGRGIAIPHGKLPKLKSMLSVFARLEVPIDFESIDDDPVDLIFLLLAPEAAGADHLKALARISRLMRDPDTIRKLRNSKDRAALYSVLTEPLATGAI